MDESMKRPDPMVTPDPTWVLILMKRIARLEKALRQAIKAIEDVEERAGKKGAGGFVDHLKRILNNEPD